MSVSVSVVIPRETGCNLHIQMPDQSLASQALSKNLAYNLKQLFNALQLCSKLAGLAILQG